MITMLEISYIELCLLCLSVSTFLTAMCLLCWVISKGGYESCIHYDDDVKDYNHHYGSYNLSPEKSYYMYAANSPHGNYALSHSPAPSDIYDYSPGQKPYLSQQPHQRASSTDGSTVSEHTKEQIINSHPHFWNNVAQPGDKRQLTSYGSLVDLPESTSGDSKKYIGYGPKTDEEIRAQLYSYATLNLQFKFLDEGKTLHELTLLQTETLGFTIRELYLELHCHMLPEDPTAREEFIKMIYPTEKKKTGGGFLTMLKSDQGSEIGKEAEDCYILADYPLSKLKQPFKITDRKLLFSCSNKPVVKGRNGLTITEKPDILAKIFIKRDDKKVYIGKSFTTKENVQYGDNRGMRSRPEEKDEENKCCVKLHFKHEPELTVGKAHITIVYLPTAEKLNIEIKKSILSPDEGEKPKQYIELYWKINLHKTDHRRSKRKLSTIRSSDQNQHLWTSDQVISFDRVTPSTITYTFVVCKLIGKIREQQELVISTGKSDETQPKTTAPVKMVNKTVELTLGEVYIGCQVPDVVCRDHWIEVIRNPRHSVLKWQAVV